MLSVHAYTTCNFMIRKFPYIFVFLSYRTNFVGTQKRIRIIQGKRAVGVRVIEVLLYFGNNIVCEAHVLPCPLVTKLELWPVLCFLPLGVIRMLYVLSLWLFKDIRFTISLSILGFPPLFTISLRILGFPPLFTIPLRILGFPPLFTISLEDSGISALVYHFP